MSPLVSIIIPVYNAEAFVAECLERARQQTYRPLEIIIVDDGSIDNSPTILRNYQAPNVKILSSSHRGASSARNIGLSAAQGNFIQYLDADDVLDTEKIGRQINVLQQDGRRVVANCSWARFKSRNAERSHFIEEAVWCDLRPTEFLIASWLGGGMMPNFAWLTPREVADAAGGWNEDLSVNDDGEYFARVLLASSNIKFVRDARGYYRSDIHASLSRVRNRAAFESEFHACKLVTSYLLRADNSVRAQHACAAAFQRFAFATYPNAIDLVRKAERDIVRLGGGPLHATGGVTFSLLSRALGWKIARRLQQLRSLLSAMVGR